MFFAAAMLMFFTTACSDSDDNGGNGGTTKKEYVKTTLKLDYTYSGAFYDLVDITTVEVLIDGTKASNATVTKAGEGSIKVDFGTIKPLSKATVNILAERNGSAVDESKTYNHKSNFNYTVTRHFSDNTTDVATLKIDGHSISGLEHATIEEYIQLYSDDSCTVEINSEGLLAY